VRFAAAALPEGHTAAATAAAAATPAAAVRPAEPTCIKDKPCCSAGNSKGNSSYCRRSNLTTTAVAPPRQQQQQQPPHKSALIRRLSVLPEITKRSWQPQEYTTICVVKLQATATAASAAPVMAGCHTPAGDVGAGQASRSGYTAGWLPCS
jgi:hypothetical protein